ncbi:unnamed protein product, partial [Sphacelaria rigidula]
ALVTDSARSVGIAHAPQPGSVAASFFHGESRSTNARNNPYARLSGRPRSSIPHFPQPEKKSMTNPSKTFCNKQRPAGYPRLDGRAHTHDILHETTAPRNGTKNNKHTINGPHDHCDRSTLRYDGQHEREQVRQEQDQVICPSMTNENNSSTRRHHANT